MNGRGQGRGRNKHKIWATNSKQTLEESSSDEGSTVIYLKVVKEEFKIILKFKEEDGNTQLGPIAVSRELIGKVHFAKILKEMEIY